MTDQGWTVRLGPVPALLWPDDENPDMPFSLTEGDLAEMLPDALDRQVAAAFAALRDALARDAQVREIVGPNTAVPLVAKDTIAALARCEIRHTVEAADAAGITVRFDIDAFDRLGGELYQRLDEFEELYQCLDEFDIDQC